MSMTTITPRLAVLVTAALVLFSGLPTRSLAADDDKWERRDDRRGRGKGRGHGDDDERHGGRHGRWDDGRRDDDSRDDDWRDRRDSSIDVRATLASAENAAEAFQRELNDALDDSRLDETREEKEIDQMAKDLENAIEAFRDDVDDDDTVRDGRPEVRAILSRARSLDRYARASWARSARDEWNVLDDELDWLARAYGIRR